MCDGVLCFGRRLEGTDIKVEQKYKLYQIAFVGNSVAKERWEQNE